MKQNQQQYLPETSWNSDLSTDCLTMTCNNSNPRGISENSHRNFPGHMVQENTPPSRNEAVDIVSSADCQSDPK